MKNKTVARIGLVLSIAGAAGILATFYMQVSPVYIAVWVVGGGIAGCALDYLLAVMRE